MSVSRTFTVAAFVFGLLSLGLCNPAPAQSKEEKKASKEADEATRKKVEATLEGLYRKAVLKGMIERNGTDVTIDQPGSVLYVRMGSVLPGSKYQPAKKIDSVDNGGKAGDVFNKSAAVLNFAAPQQVPVSTACDKGVIISIAHSSNSLAMDACRGDIAAGNAGYFPAGQAVILGKIAVMPATEAIAFTILDYNKNPDGTIAKPQVMGHVIFLFPPGTLASATSDTLSDAVNKVFSMQPVAAGSGTALNASLNDQLKTVYIAAGLSGDLAKLGNTVTITQPGTVVSLLKADNTFGEIYKAVGGGISAKMGMSSLMRSQSRACGRGSIVNLPEGKFEEISAACQKDIDAGHAVKLTVGQKLMVAQVGVLESKDMVVLNMLDYNPVQGVPGPPRFVAGFAFQFPKGYLASANVRQIEDAIATVFAIDSTLTPPQAAAPSSAVPATPAAPPSSFAPIAAPPAPTPSVQIGMTTDEVIAILGQPKRSAIIGSKTIYSYSDMKIIFIKGKVTDIQ